MVGRHKQANRTKNNVRPSSSSHSAQLLGNAIPTFFGFSVTKDGGPGVSGLPKKEANTSIHSDFQIMFKQMSKKDPTTRFKALQMFTDSCNNLDTNSVVEMLPLWPRMYCTLCTDIDHKVREVTHKAHHAVVSKVKKMIAPHLKELAGPWFTSQYDTYPPAASAATLAFQEAFPGDKYKKAIVFCQKEILSYIYDNLINQTPQTLSAPNTSAEDMDAKYERIIISSLQGYNLYLQKLSPDEIEQAVESNKQLLSNPKFWKYSKNKVAAIRNSFYHTVITICQSAKFLLADESSRLSSAVFNNLDESDPLVLQAVWEAALNVLVTIEDCLSRINIEKQVFSKLFLILKNGGRNVATIYPSILPLLSKLPEDLIKDKETFYKNLFDNLRRGLSLNFLNQSNSDERIIANAFVECLKYVIMRNMSDERFCVSLVEDQLIPALEEKLNENKSKRMPTTPFFLQTACLVRYWHSNRNTGNATHEKLVEIFFSSLFTLFTRHVESEISRGELEDILNNQAELLIVLSRPDQFSPRHKGRVKFKDEAEEEKPVTVELKSNESRFEVDMLPIAKKLGVFYFRNAIEKEERHYIRPLNKLLTAFNAGVILEEMTKAVNESTPFKLFAEYFSKWLTMEGMKCDELVDISLKLLKHVSNDEKEYILEEFCRDWFSPENSQLSLDVCKALSNCFDDQFVVDWVRSERFVRNMIDLVEKYVTSDDGDDSKLRDFIVTMLKTKTGKGEFIIPSEMIDRIMGTLSENLDKRDEDISHLIDLSQDLISRTRSEGNVSPSLESLVAALFKLSCRKLEDESLTHVCNAGLSIVLSRCQDSGLEFARKLSQVVKEIIFGMDDDDEEEEEEEAFNLDQIVLNVKNYVTLCNNACSKGSLNPETEVNKEIIKAFINGETDLWKEDETVKEMEKLCRIGYENGEDLDFEYLESVNYLKSSSESKIPPETETSFELKPIKQYAEWNLFVGNVLNLTATSHSGGNETSMDEGEEGDGEEEKSVVLDTNEESKSEVVATESRGPEENVTLRPVVDDVSGFLMSVGLFGSFAKYYGSTRHYYQLKESVNKLKTIACDLLKNVSLPERQFIYNHCKVFIDKKSTWWLVRKTFREVFGGNFVEQPEEVERGDHGLGKRYLVEFKELDFGKMSGDPGNFMKISSYVERGFGHLISETQWDRIFIYVHNSVDGFLTKDHPSDFDLLTLSSVARLFSKLTNAFRENHTKPDDERIPSETCVAWNQLVQAEVYNKFLSAWRVLCRKCYDQKELTPEWHVALENVGDVAAAGSALRKMDSVNESVEFALECTRFMVSPHAVVQITSFRLCLSLVPVLVQIDTETFGDNVTETRDEDENTLFEPLSNSDCNWIFKKFEHDFKQNQGIVELILSDFKIGDCCAAEPFTDSFTYIYWYLLFSCFLMEMCGEAHSPLRFQYGSWLMDSGYIVLFLKSVFKLMPQDVLRGTEAKEKCSKHFESYGCLDFREPVESERIERIACYAYRLFLTRLPNLTREWWRHTDSKTSGFVDKVTTLYVSPILISLEFKNLNKESVLDQIEVKTYLSSREVIATYTVDDVKMDIILTLPTNYPLGTINIESTSKMLAMSNSRSLLFRLSKYFLNQNGTIWDALAIWKNSLDKKFHGREECYICFSIVQGSSLETPRLSCYTCKKKFHSGCLYKWFNTSNKSTCPICRNLF